ncbi:unnamed protein product [Taenia asiatica]|uniref:Armadillo repeat-containing protein 8 n=1 Tax=Taenia asiatica TaxID=60517 RepID=A0A0R3VUK5_TAEAS|nr:unnamed protein product [Taenia asiatica]
MLIFPEGVGADRSLSVCALEQSDPTLQECESRGIVSDEGIKRVLDLILRGAPDEINAATAYICHLSYQNLEVRRKVADYGGIEVLSGLLLSPIQEFKKYVVSTLRNLSYDCTPEIRKKMDESSVISNLLVVLDENTNEDIMPLQFSMSLNAATVESATATLCNLSLYPEFKDTISRNGLPCLIKNIILPYSVVAQNSSTLIQSEEPAAKYDLPTFIYATGTIRNILVEDAECRHRLRETMGLVAALSRICSQCVKNYDFDGKALENCVCILRNLSFALQEVRDPAYLVRREAAYSIAAITPMAEKRLLFKHPGIDLKAHRRGIVMNLRRPPTTNIWMGGGPDYLDRPPSNLESIQGSRLLWAQDLIENYISILRHSTNLAILEAAAGAIQNLTACEWEPSAEVRSFFRSGDNVLVLAAPLISEDDGVVLTTATALRNVAEEESLRSLVAFYAMRLLIARLPVLQAPSTIDGEIVVPTHNVVSLHTASAILAALYVLVKANSERASLFFDCGGVQPCLAIAHTGLYVDPTDPVPSNRDKTVRFARFLLQALWAQRDLQERFKKAGLRAAHFCVHEPIVRDALKQSLTTAIRSSAGTLKPIDKENLGSLSEPSKPQEADTGLSVKHPLDNGVQNSLPPAVRLIAGEHDPSSCSHAPFFLAPLRAVLSCCYCCCWHNRWAHTNPPPLVAALIQVCARLTILILCRPHQPSRFRVFSRPIPKVNIATFQPALLLLLPFVITILVDNSSPHSITPPPSFRPVSRRMSRLSVVPEASLSSLPRSRPLLSENGESNARRFNYAAKERVFFSVKCSPVKSQNQLYVPGQQGLLETLPKSSSSDIRHSSNVFGMQHSQGWSEAESSLSPTALLSNASSSEERWMLAARFFYGICSLVSPSFTSQHTDIADHETSANASSKSSTASSTDTQSQNEPV